MNAQSAKWNARNALDEALDELSWQAGISEPSPEEHYSKFRSPRHVRPAAGGRAGELKSFDQLPGRARFTP